MGRKGRKEYTPADDDYEPADAAAAVVEEDEQHLCTELSGKKKCKSKAKSGAGESASVQDEGEAEVLSEIQPSGKQKQDDSRSAGKRKGGKNAKDDDENEATLWRKANRKVQEEEEEDEDPLKKGKNELELAETDEDEDLDVLMRFTGKKKGKKKPGSLHLPAAQDEDEAASPVKDRKAATVDDDDIPRSSASKKIKQKPPSVDEDEGEGLDMLLRFSGRKGGAVEDENEEEDDENFEESIQFTGKKKSKKGKKPPVESSTRPELSQLEKDEPTDEPIQFTGKKKSRKDKKLQPSDPDVFNQEQKPEPADEGLQFSGKDKSKHEQPSLEEQEEKDEVADGVIQFTGKKRSKKEKKPTLLVSSSIMLEEGEDEPAKQPMEDSPDSGSTVIQTSAVGAPSPKEAFSREKSAEVDELDERAREIEASSAKNKSKKKKKVDKEKGKTEGEFDDLDKLLMEIEAPTDKKPKSAKAKVPPPAEDASEVAEQVQAVPDARKEEIKQGGEQAQPDGEEQAESSAAAKKKKKKKEKEKAKAAAAGTDAGGEAAPQNEEVKPKAGAKPVPKALRAVHERLAKMKEQEEQRRREEEERRRKEEEEQARLEQLEREKEEAKRRRKEREKQKREEKKRAGIILTKKEKEEARRLAIMREQILRDRGLDVDPEEGHATAPKKPRYEAKKKRKPEAATSETAEGSNGDKDTIEVTEMLPDEADVMDINAEEDREEAEEPDAEEDVEEEEEEDDWDAKSWDDEVSLKPLQKTLADEEEEEAEEPARPAPTKSISPNPSFKAHAEDTAKVPLPKVIAADPSKAPADVDKDQHVKTSPVDKAGDATEKIAPSEAQDDYLRSPICCILGHVDTGKTKLLDCIRRTKVQEGEAGGITQQIGATYFPRENIREKTKELKEDAKLRVPGLLVIDTPGHESFTNLRARGSGLCDIAVLVIDIMHGLEPQTIESLNLLKMRKTPYVIALNKVDRLYGWKVRPNAPISIALKDQPKETKQEFETRVTQVITQLKEQGLNSELYWRNKELAKKLRDKDQKKTESDWSDDDYANIVPTSAITGEGIPDLLLLLVQLTQKMLETRLTFKTELECTVLEVKVVEGLGTTIDVVLVNGVLHEGDQIVVCGMQGPIVATIRALLTPHPMKELRVKGSYQHHKELKAAQGIKITAQGLEHAIAGTQLYVVGPEDDIDEIKNEAMQDVNNVLSRIDKSGEGVCVQASTLGSLEALLEFLKSPAVKIPVSGISIGPVHKKDVMRASVMLEKRKEYAAILAFDVKVNPEARELADELGVRIFTADIIYHLFDQFTAYMEAVKNEKRSQSEGEAVFPCILKILPGCVFNNKDPIIVGVEVLEGVAKVGTPLCVPKKGFIDLGRIASLEINHKVVDVARRGEQVAMKIVGNVEESQKSFGRHFELEDELVSHITRRSIDVLKENFRDEVSKDEWRLITKLKALFQIQ